MNHKKIAFLFPGQGAQYVGMGSDFFRHFPIARETFEEADEKLGRFFSRLIFHGSSKELTATKNAQLAIYIVSIALFRVLAKEFPSLSPQICAGLSLGEYSALTSAKYLTFQDGIELVEARGLYMHEASGAFPGTMAVCLGAKLKTVEEIIETCRAVSPVWIANLNSPGQVVISGTHQGIEMATKALLKIKEVKKVVSLDVSGAFHSGLMESAKQKLASKLDRVFIHKSNIQIILNVLGDFPSSIEEVRHCLLEQVVSPVYWEKSIRRMDDEEKVDLFIEIGCGKTLSGINRKIKVQGKSLNLEKLEDLNKIEKALELIVL